jgi:shikimate dehydrogenase
VSQPGKAAVLGSPIAHSLSPVLHLAALRETGLRSAAVLVRDRARAGDLLAAAVRFGMKVDLRPFEAGVRDGDLLVSTVPARAADPYAERAWFSRPGVPAVLDVVHSPWPTPLARAAARSGAVVVSGFDLLLHQAARQVELMTGIKPAPLDHMRAAGQAELTRRAT